MTATETPAARPEGTAHPHLRKLLLALALTLVVVLLCRAIEVEPGEATWLRWLRVLADHPVRAFLAAVLLVHASAPARAPREEPEQPPRS